MADKGHSYSAIPGDNNKCECADHGCPAHKGRSGCKRYANIILYRVDMQDELGTAMCEACADDAMLTGLFTDDTGFEAEIVEVLTQHQLAN